MNKNEFKFDFGFEIYIFEHLVRNSHAVKDTLRMNEWMNEWMNEYVGTVNVFDSFYNDIDKESKLQIANILKPTGKIIKFNIISVQRQAGGTECGLFAIAFAVALGLGFTPTKLLFKQESMGVTSSNV